MAKLIRLHTLNMCICEFYLNKAVKKDKIDLITQHI